MKNAGLTLVEVLVAAVVAALCVAALAGSAHAVLASRAASERRLAMGLVARMSLEEMLAADPEAVVESDVSDEVADRFGPFRRRRVVAPGPNEGLWHLRVTVNGPANADLSVHTLVRRTMR